MEEGFEDKDRLRAAEALLDRGFGKAAQAVISVPVSKQQAAILAGMSDDALVAIIEQKQLPRATPKQSLITVEPSTPNQNPKAPRRPNPHGPEDLYITDIDPLLL